MKQSLKGRRIAILAADGFEKVELTVPSAGLLDGRVLTSWPGIRDDLVNAGATWLDQDVVADGRLVTSRGPQDLATFVPAIIDLFPGKGSRTRCPGTPRPPRSETSLRSSSSAP